MELRTTDIILAASLKVLGAKMSHIEKNGNKGTFVFDNVDEQTVNDYDLGNLLVEPISFNTAIKQLTTATRRP
jgi:hypothetical protein